MVKLHTAGLVVLSLVLVTNIAAGQSLSQPFNLTPELKLDSSPVLAAQSSGHRRDSLWNGTLIGLGAGLGSAFAMHKTFDALLCEAPDGCETPWRAYAMFGAIGAGAGAGIDLLINRESDPRKATVRISPIIGPARQGVRASLMLPQRGSLPAPARARQSSSGGAGDSLMNGAWIGAGLGAVGGIVLARGMCGWNDKECAVYSGLVTLPVGIGVGAAVGAIADALHK